jgi:tetratricopeptide (TPR) repeat protein
MRKCELCGAEIPKKLETCSRCGFEFQKEIRSDVRDRAILDKHEGKTVENVNRDMKNRQAQLMAHLDNMAAKNLSVEELVSLLDESLTFLQIPLALGVEDELRFNTEEKKFISQVANNLETADSENNGPVGTSGTYTRLSNALQSMGEHERAMQMIEKALLINPKDRDAMFGKAKLLFYGKKYEASKKCLERLTSAGGDKNAKYLSELIEQIIMS